MRIPNIYHEEQIQISFHAGLSRQTGEVRNNYAAEVSYMDKHLGVLWDTLEELKVLDRTVVLLTADHGEALGEKDHVGHIAPLIQPLTRVPFVIYLPKGQKNSRSKELVCHLDILPTLLDLLNVESKSKMSGINLAPLVRKTNGLSAETGKRNRVFSATYAPAASKNSFAVVEWPLKLVLTRTTEDWKAELYDLSRDLQEEVNLIDSDSINPSTLAAMRKALEEYAHEAETMQSQHQNPKLDEEAKEMLHDLGYITP